MFFGIIILAIGLVLILNALGIVTGSFWTLFWGILFLAIGIRLLVGRKKCFWCDWSCCGTKIHKKFHEHVHAHEGDDQQ